VSKTRREADVKVRVIWALTGGKEERREEREYEGRDFAKKRKGKARGNKTTRTCCCSATELE
jgi:hypothetical protein